MTYGWIPEWPKGTDCKSAATRFESTSIHDFIDAMYLSHQIRGVFCFSGNTCICLLIILGIKDILLFNNTHANYLKENQEGISCNMKELFTDHRVRHAV